MKKLSKLILTFILIFTISQPIIASAQEVNEEEQTEEQAEEENNEDNDNEEQDNEEDTGEGTPVDEDNEEPTLGETSNSNQSQRDSEVIRQPVETPASVTGEQYQGIGTVVDFTTHGSREIYTISTPDNSVYYLMIDWDMTENNVYFLSPVNDEEMIVENNMATQSQSSNVSQDTIQSENTESTEDTSNVETEETEGSNITFWILLILMTIGIFGYHLFFGKLKNLNPFTKENEENDEIEEDVDIYNEEEFLVGDEDYHDEEDNNEQVDDR